MSAPSFLRIKKELPAAGPGRSAGRKALVSMDNVYAALGSFDNLLNSNDNDLQKEMQRAFSKRKGAWSTSTGHVRSLWGKGIF